MKILEWVKSHPLETGGIVFAVGLVGLWMLGLFGSSSSSASGADAASASEDAAYYNAEAQQGEAGDELQATEIAAQASTDQTALNDTASVTENSTWATTSEDESNSQETEAEALAPYATESQLISTLGSVAALPPVISTNANSGFLGIGASSSTSANPEPQSLLAESELDDLQIAGLTGNNEMN